MSNALLPRRARREELIVRAAAQREELARGVVGSLGAKLPTNRA